MGDSRLKKTSYNVLSLLIYQIIVFVCNLILPRLILTNYGSAYNGIVSSITQFLNIVSILRLGVAGATRVSLYKTLAYNDNEGTSRIIKASENYLQKIGWITLIYIAVLSVVFPIIAKRGEDFLGVSILVVALGLGTFAQYFFGMTYQTLLDADQRQYIYNIVMIITTILNTSISSLLIIAGCSLQMVKIASGLLFFISPFILSRYVIKRYHINRKCKPDTNALNQRKDAMGHSIANIIHENTDMIILTLFTSVETVSVYAVYALVMNGLKQVLYVFTTGSEAVFGDMWAKGERISIEHNLSLFEFLIGGFVIIVFSATAILLIPFVKLYTSNVNDVNYIIPIYAAVIVLAQVFYCIRLPYLTLVQAAGKYKETKNGAYLEAAINLGTSVILVNVVGIVGTAIGTLLANIIRTIQYVYYTYIKLLNYSILLFVKRIVWIIMGLLISIMCGYYLVYTMASKSWWNWIISGIVMVIISGLVCLVSALVLYRSDVIGMKTIISRLLKKRA